MKMRAVAVGVVLLLMAATAACAQGAEDYHANPKFIAAVKEAQKKESQRQFGPAINLYKKAINISGGKCVECLNALYGAQINDGSYKDAIATAQEMGTVGATALVKSVAALDLGRAMLAMDGDKANPEQLEQVHATFREAIDLYPSNVAAVFEDAEVLERMGKTDDARKEFELCLSEMKPNDPAYMRVKHFAEDPELAMHKMAPVFEVTSLDGSRFNLDAMDGRVVLVDFWATWCGPCNEELPELKKIAKEFAGQPFVMISVSVDQNDAAWKAFVQKHEMTWVQYRDADHKLADAFGVTSIPRYFTIDSDGVLTSEMMGEGADVEGTLRKLITKAEEAKQMRASARAGGSGLPPGR
ncbi:MAG: redoxin family protein [Acidobacteriaceae bacterium]